MFWAIQGMAAELSTGALIIMKIKQLNRNISMLVIKNEAQFTKKAKGQIIFSCTQGKEIDMLLQKAIETGIGQTITLTAEGRDASGDVVSVFNFLWSVKLKS
jgi:16S rRNA U1498 N3-methylase RsmE